MRKFVVITLLPEMFANFVEHGVVGNAFKNGKAQLVCINPREYATDRHRTVDDVPYGGGPGMVLKPEPLDAAINAAHEKAPAAKVCHLSPSGKRFEDGIARDLATQQEMILLCGRYLGIDQRVLDRHVDYEISVGDYVASGGELPAMVIMDAVLRHVKGVLGDAESAEQESFAKGLLAPPCYTRPAEHAGYKVPEILLTGDHAQISKWRQDNAQKRTEKWQGLNEKKGVNSLQSGDK